MSVAQPLLDLIGRNPPFFVAHGMGAGDVVALGLIVALVAPLGVGAVVVLVARVHRRAGVVLAAVAVALLATAQCLVVARLSGLATRAPGVAVILAAAALGAAAGAVWVRSGAVRRLLELLSPVALVVVILFVAVSPARSIVRPPDPPASAGRIPQDAPPIVLVVFDELPVTSLMDAQRGIDAAAFPGFGRLAADATWYRNTTAAHGFTPNAVPAILTGRYTPREALPLAADHPVNLFSVLRDAYRLHVAEPVTDLCAAPECEPTRAPDYGRILRDLAVVGGHLLAPPDLAGRLPSLDQGFADFRAEVARKGKHAAFVHRLLPRLEDDLPAAFGRFIAGVRSDAPRTLSFAHVLLPHRPWRYLPDGRVYAGVEDIAGTRGRAWKRDPWSSVHGYQRHLLQLQLADRLLADLLERLDSEGLYDDALVVVVADHGISFAPGVSLRGPSRQTAGAVAPVPLLVKLPGQTAGTISDAPAETVDVFPTIMDVLDVTVADDLDGRSLVGPVFVRRDVKQFHTVDGEVIRFSATGEEKWEVLARKLTMFDAARGPLDPFRAAPAAARGLLGRAVPASTTPSDMSVTLDAPQLYEAVDLDARFLPALLTGAVTVSGRAPTLAIGVNGTIVAATVADGDGAFRAMLPPAAMRQGANQIDVYEVGARGTLRRLATAPRG